MPRLDRKRWCCDFLDVQVHWPFVIEYLTANPRALEEDKYHTFDAYNHVILLDMVRRWKLQRMSTFDNFYEYHEEGGTVASCCAYLQEDFYAGLNDEKFNDPRLREEIRNEVL
ncbi:unnamed protein product [Symbiodinium natans]|uniref:Uncharacterized protein n=1 Tax=Symbiodinium natans TaxID=878477 RepID=A0A812GMU9_9DINO|nr:unnamed protein product [Symbiodinium natans]